MKLDFVEKMGIQSWCFRSIQEPAGVVAALKECGVERIEFSHAHLKPWEHPDPLEYIQYYTDNGITFSCYGAFGMGGNEADARKTFEFVKAAGHSVINVMFGEGGLELAEKLCAEYGLKAALHNHGRHDPNGSVWRLEEIFSSTCDNIGLCLDTAWMIDAGEDPIEVAEKFAGRLYGVHVKDFIFNRAGKPEDIIVGEGNLDLPGFLRKLVDVEFDGFFTLEYEGDVDNPVPSTKKCVEAIRRAAAALQG
jgi:sugar phosphate isomerase/epimerase